MHVIRALLIGAMASIIFNQEKGKLDYTEDKEEGRPITNNGIRVKQKFKMASATGGR